MRTQQWYPSHPEPPYAHSGCSALCVFLQHAPVAPQKPGHAPDVSLHSLQHSSPLCRIEARQRHPGGAFGGSGGGSGGGNGHGGDGLGGGAGGSGKGGASGGEYGCGGSLGIGKMGGGDGGDNGGGNTGGSSGEGGDGGGEGGGRGKLGDAIWVPETAAVTAT